MCIGKKDFIKCDITIDIKLIFNVIKTFTTLVSRGVLKKQTWSEAKTKLVIIIRPKVGPTLETEILKKE